MNKKKFGRIIIVVCVLALITANSSIKAFAVDKKEKEPEVFLNSDNKIQLPNGTGIINEEIMPGDKIIKAFDIRNKSSKTVSFYMSSNMEVTNSSGEPVVKVDGKEFAEDLIRKLQLTLKKEDGTILYQGPASGDMSDANVKYKAALPNAAISNGFLGFNTKSGIGLGTLMAGTSMRLIAILDVPGDAIGNEYQNTFSIFNWEFYCQGEDDKTQPGNPD
ncbi:MAG: hypothetical protein RRZ33_09430, partial [Lachnospiraceae bacterium]